MMSLHNLRRISHWKRQCLLRRKRQSLPLTVSSPQDRVNRNVCTYLVNNNTSSSSSSGSVIAVPKTSISLWNVSATSVRTNVQMAGNGWTGAMGIGSDGMTSSETSHVSPDDRENSFASIPIQLPLPLIHDDEDEEARMDSNTESKGDSFQLDWNEYSVRNAAVGWGHSILHIQSNDNDNATVNDTDTVNATDNATVNANDTADTNNQTTKEQNHDYENHSLLISGRPFDFQTLLRINRLPPFVARFVVSNSLRLEQSSLAMGSGGGGGGGGADQTTGSDVSFLTTLVNSFFQTQDTNNKDGDDDDASMYRTGMYPSFTPMNLPKGEIPACTSASNGFNNNNNINNNHNHTITTTTMAASAGLSAVLSTSGKVYTLGMNHKGQCGIQDSNANFVWEWTPLVFSNLMMSPTTTSKSKSKSKSTSKTTNDKDTEEETEGAAHVPIPEPEPPRMISLALGLQHGLSLGENGRVYAWGKGSRGQLGLDRLESNIQTDAQAAAQLDANVKRRQVSTLNTETDAPTITSVDVEYAASPIVTLSNVTQISAGWNHSVAISDNQVFIWGKNVQLKLVDTDNENDNDGGGGGGGGDDKPKQESDNSNSTEDYQPCDATHPQHVPGLPTNLTIERISCGSHHTAALLQDGSVYAMGVASDNATLIPHFVQVIPPGHVDICSILQFKSHFDRTTIILDEGRQVLEFQLWSTPELREEAVFEPAWVQNIVCEHEIGNSDGIEEKEMPGKKSVQMVHRGWQHTLLVTGLD